MNLSLKLKLQRNLWLPIRQNIYRKPRTIVTFRNEQRASKGKLEPKIDTSSVLIFTIHKSASSFVNKFLKAISQDTDYIRLNYAGYFRGLLKDPAKIFEQNEFLSEGFSNKGFIYGPLRWNIKIPNKESFKVVLILRDPRDVLVSLYYSRSYSHAINFKTQIDKRIQAREQDIDSFVKSEAPSFLKRFENYMELLEPPYKTFYLRYRDLISDPDSSLKSILNFMCVAIKPETYQDLIGQLKLPATEDIKKHRRSGRTEQFREKLKPETIEFLNNEFAEIIEFFGFGVKI